MKLTLGTLFSGIKAPEKALTNLGIDFESKFTSEWDIYATVGGNEIHNNNQKINYPTEDEMRKHLLQFTWSSDGKKPCGEDYIKRMKGNKLKGLYKAQIQSNNLGSILDINIDKLPHVDMLAWGSPCQDFSVAGNGKGSTWTCEECNHEYNPLFVDYQKRDMCPKCNSDNIEHTRSSLIIKGLETVRKVQPKVSIFENVEGLTYKNHKDGFKAFLKELESYGYKNFHKVVNAKHWGIPQKRKRIFVISFRKDVDCSSFNFPVSSLEKNGKTDKEKIIDMPKVILKDVVEEEVAEKYYLNDKYLERFVASLLDEEKQSEIPKNILGTTKPDGSKGTKSRHWVYDLNKEMGTLCASDYKQPKQIIEPVLRNYGIWKVDSKEMSNCLDANYSSFPDNHGARTGVLEILNIFELFNTKPLICEECNSKDITWEINKWKCNNNHVVKKEKELKIKKIGGIKNDTFTIGESKISQGNRIYSISGVACTINAQGGGRGAKTGLYLIKDIKQDQKEHNEERIPFVTLADNKENNRKSSGLFLVKTDKGVEFILTNENIETITNIIINFRIRKLTPLECWRLMGFADADYYKVKKTMEKAFYNGNDRSDSRMYKMAGNSIVVDVLKVLSKEIIKVLEQN